MRRQFDQQLQRDDRAWLESLFQQNWSPTAANQALSDILDSIVSSLHFENHQQWGLQVPKSELLQVRRDFLTWMKDSGEWDHIRTMWSKDLRGPWPLAAALSRCFCRFKAAHSKPKSTELSHSGLRQMTELPQSRYLDGLTQGMTSELLGAFASMTAQLPEDLRLPYQLHLEGLIDTEIANLLSTDEKLVARAIQNAKTLLTVGVPPRRSGERS